MAGRLRVHVVGASDVVRAGVSSSLALGVIGIGVEDFSV